MRIEKKNITKTLILIMFNVLLTTVAQMSGSLVFIAIAMLTYMFTMLISDDETVFPLILFFLPWSPILKLSPSSISFYSVTTILLFLKYFIRRPKFNVKIVFSVLGLFVITLFSKMIHGYGIAPSYFMFLVMLVAFPFMFEIIREKVNFELCVQFFSVGIILATLVSLLYGSSPNMIQYVKVLQQENLGVTRLCGFYADPNFYSAQIVTAFGGLLLVITKRRKKILLEVVFAILLVICGLISLSKSFLLCMLIVLALWLLALLRYRPSKMVGAGFVIALVAVALVASGALDDIILQYMIRFGEATDASSLTTGRTDLWIEYINFMVDHPMDFFFGQGYTSVFNGVRKGSHNTLIQAFYQLGLLGLVGLTSWLGAFKTKTKLKQKSNGLLSIVWLVACFSMWVGLDMMFFDDLFVNITLLVFGSHYISKIFDSDASV